MDFYDLKWYFCDIRYFINATKIVDNGTFEQVKLAKK